MSKTSSFASANLIGFAAFGLLEKTALAAEEKTADAAKKAQCERAAKLTLLKRQALRRFAENISRASSIVRSRGLETS